MNRFTFEEQIEPQLTPEQYRDQGGIDCPFCLSEDIDYGEDSIGIESWDKYCKSCGRRWWEDWSKFGYSFDDTQREHNQKSEAERLLPELVVTCQHGVEAGKPCAGCEILGDSEPVKTGWPDGLEMARKTVVLNILEPELITCPHGLVMGVPCEACEHQAQHRHLHACLGELIADFIDDTDKLPSTTRISELMEWSSKQRFQQ